MRDRLVTGRNKDGYRLGQHASGGSSEERSSRIVPTVNHGSRRKGGGCKITNLKKNV